jgi:hypothetical protein
MLHAVVEIVSDKRLLLSMITVRERIRGEKTSSSERVKKL